MKSLAKTPPFVKKAWSFFKASRDPSSDPGTEGTCASSSFDSSKMSLSSGPPGSILFSMPSNPAINIAEYAMYGLHDASGGRNSNRFDFGLDEYIGMRTAAERFRREYARLTGASKPGTSRLYEFVDGAAKPRMAGACFRSPPAYQRAVWLRSAYLSPPK